MNLDPRDYTATELAIILFLLVGAGYILLLGSFWGVGALAIAGALALVSYHSIPPDPPTAALLTAWNQKTHILRGEGVMFALYFFPLMERLVQDTLTPTSIAFIFDAVACRARMPSPDGRLRSGGSVRVTGILTFIPDSTSPTRFATYIERGKRPEVRRVVLGMLGEAIREEGLKVDWETFKFSRDRLSASLVTVLTGEEPERDTDEGIRAFLAEIFEEGTADVQGLGILILKLNIESIEPVGRLASASEGLAVEDQERSGEEVDTETSIRLAEQYVTAAKRNGETLTMKEAMAQVRVDRGRATEIQGRGRNIAEINSGDRDHHGHGGH